MLAYSDEEMEILKGLCDRFHLCRKCKNKNQLCFLKRRAYKIALKVHKAREKSKNKEV